MVLDVDEELKRLAILVAYHGYGRNRRENRSVATLQEPLCGVPVVPAVCEALENVSGWTVARREQERDVLADELVDAETGHRAEGLVHDVDAKRGEAHDQVSQRAALEHRLIEAQPLLEGGGICSQPARGDPPDQLGCSARRGPGAGNRRRDGGRRADGRRETWHMRKLGACRDHKVTPRSQTCAGAEAPPITIGR